MPPGETSTKFRRDGDPQRIVETPSGEPGMAVYMHGREVLGVMTVVSAVAPAGMAHMLRVVERAVAPLAPPLGGHPASGVALELVLTTDDEHAPDAVLGVVVAWR